MLSRRIACAMNLTYATRVVGVASESFGLYSIYVQEKISAFKYLAMFFLDGRMGEIGLARERAGG